MGGAPLVMANMMNCLGEASISKKCSCHLDLFLYIFVDLLFKLENEN